MSDPTDIPASKERQLDAAEIEKLIEQEGLITRPSVKAHLEALVQKIKRDALALKRLEDSRAKAEAEAEAEADISTPAASVTATPAPAPAAAVPAAAPPAQSPSMKYKSIDKFSFDAGSYNSPTVTIYILLSKIGSIPKSQIQCTFTSSSFDLTIHDFETVNYRLFRDNLAHEIDSENSKCVIKPNKIILKLKKIKSDYGTYDSWNELTSNKSKAEQMKSKKDPTAGIMDLMKDMYDKGDDKMKKMIGETMLKQREGKLDKPGASMDMGGMDF